MVRAVLRTIWLMESPMEVEEEDFSPSPLLPLTLSVVGEEEEESFGVGR